MELTVTPEPMLPYFALTRSASDAERFAACLLYPFVCSFDILLAVVLSAA
jgi:hypothetical protein